MATGKSGGAAQSGDGNSARCPSWAVVGTMEPLGEYYEQEPFQERVFSSRIRAQRLVIGEVDQTGTSSVGGGVIGPDHGFAARDRRK